MKKNISDNLILTDIPQKKHCSAGWFPDLKAGVAEPGTTSEGVLRRELLVAGTLADRNYYNLLRMEYAKKYAPLRLTLA